MLPPKKIAQFTRCCSVFRTFLDAPRGLTVRCCVTEPTKLAVFSGKVPRESDRYVPVPKGLIGVLVLGPLVPRVLRGM